MLELLRPSCRARRASRLSTAGSRSTGQDMQRGPPRPLPSSLPWIRITSMPAASSRALVSMLRSYATASRGPTARVLLPSSHCSRSAVTGSRPVSITLSRSMPIACAAASRNGRARETRRSPLSLVDGVGGQGVRHGRVHDDLVDVDHRADRVEVHRGALLRDRHRQHGVHQARMRTPAGPAAPRPPASYAPRCRWPARPVTRSRTSPPSTCSRARLVHQLGARRTAGGGGRSAGSARSRGGGAGIARLVTATRSPIHTLESRVNRRFGSGSMTKSCRSMSW